MTGVLYALLVLGGMGLLFGLGLSVAAIKLKVETDPRLPLLREALPGANCGGCGFAGCDAFAEALLTGKASPSGCPVGGATSAQAIGQILGVPVTIAGRQNAFVRCGGCESKSLFRYDYQGLSDCKAAMQLAGGGSKACVYGCLGVGSCKAACQFGAIEMIDGIAVVNREKCAACTMCVRACPKQLIAMVPYNNTVHVACVSGDPGREARKICKAGCIKCKLCEKACQFDAVHVKDNGAIIDYAKCTQCGECVKKCPSKCITALGVGIPASVSEGITQNA
ncbi:MAG: RnfABCDGE type electron transport complex subunit B [Clostridiales bacterium]|jgi:Na+-translocating ferredoxin:NAD+ oxidoreductase RNF subunit RnfB|nr:RnfABCDGE type electron transport complex subunit B [Clostridiales bacterium]